MNSDLLGIALAWLLGALGVSSGYSVSVCRGLTVNRVKAAPSEKTKITTKERRQP